ncbi:hypothetical protein ES708_13414 [subsurface metagenome]
MFATISANAGHKFVDRGDLIAYDFTLTDFEFDTTWNVLDLSAKIPKGAVLALITITETCAQAYPFMFRTKGYTHGTGTSIFTAAGGSMNTGHTVLVVPDKDALIEYLGYAAAGCEAFDFTVGRYFI